MCAEGAPEKYNRTVFRVFVLKFCVLSQKNEYPGYDGGAQEDQQYKQLYSGVTHPADPTLPVGGCVPWPVVFRQTTEVVDTETSVTLQHVSRKVTLKAVPVMTFCFPVLKHTEYSNAHPRPPGPPPSSRKQHH